ncbi:MAG: transcriptional repressor [Desulfobulbaceae bacterium]|nr:transcriptional repressor [Desulfobulbaceae bacterium]
MLELDQIDCSSLRITKQRQLILDELMSVKSHPTADELYQMVRKRLPKISLGTVYRNLEIMSDCGVIQKLDIGGTQKRFDANAETHYHVRCAKCGKVDDIDMPPDRSVEKEAGKLSKYTIIRHRLEFTGICPACK